MTKNMIMEDFKVRSEMTIKHLRVEEARIDLEHKRAIGAIRTFKSHLKSCDDQIYFIELPLQASRTALIAALCTGCPAVAVIL
eukprot:IDg5361t1